MALEGFTSASTGEQLFTLTGSVEGSLTGLLEITGTDLDLIDGITVTGTQYAAVEIGDLVNTGDAISAPISITSTANGGFTLQIGDAVVTVSVTYVRPGVTLTSSLIGGIPLVREGNVHSNASVTITRSDMVGYIGLEETIALYMNGNDMRLVELNNVEMSASLLDAENNVIWQKQATPSLFEQNQDRVVFNGYCDRDYTESDVQVGGVYILSCVVSGVTMNGYSTNYFHVDLGIEE